MGNGLNRVVLFGNLGVDPELRRLQGGTTLLSLRLGTNYSVASKDGGREDRVEWHRVSVWGARAEGLSRILHRGSFVLVEGHIRTRSYEKDGEKRWTTEVHADNVILGGRCGPDGHRDMEAGRDDEARTMEESYAPDDMRDPYEAPHPGGMHDPEVMEPVRPEPRAPRGDGGGQEAPLPTPPLPPPPRKKNRSSGPVSAAAAA